MENIMGIIWFLVILLALITVHELGHFIAAKVFNVYVTEFSLGFGPKIYQRKGKETTFSIRALPLGGYAAMVGEDGVISEDLAHIPHERTVKGVNRFKQFIIMFAGSAMNLLLGLLICIALATTQDRVNPEAIIGQVSPNSPAEIANVQPNDKIIEIIQNDKVIEVNSFTDLSQFNQTNTNGDAFSLMVLRNNEKVKIDVKPQYNEESKGYIIGVTPSIIPASYNIIDGIKYGFTDAKDMAFSIINSLKQLVTGKVSADQLSGPVGIFQITKDVGQQAGLIGLIKFSALLSINLGIFNLLPVPALDGGRILILTIEAITRRKVSEKVEYGLIIVGYVALLGLMLFATFNDILRLFN